MKFKCSMRGAPTNLVCDCQCLHICREAAHRINALQQIQRVIQAEDDEQAKQEAIAQSAPVVGRNIKVSRMRNYDLDLLRLIKSDPELAKVERSLWDHKIQPDQLFIRLVPDLEGIDVRNFIGTPESIFIDLKEVLFMPMMGMANKKSKEAEKIITNDEAIRRLSAYLNDRRPRGVPPITEANYPQAFQRTKEYVRLLVAIGFLEIVIDPYYVLSDPLIKIIDNKAAVGGYLETEDGDLMLRDPLPE